jgi:methyl-accepting chemotaxis protein
VEDYDLQLLKRYLIKIRKMETKIDYKWIVNLTLLVICIFLQYQILVQNYGSQLKDISDLITKSNQKIAEINQDIDSIQDIKNDIINKINHNHNDYQTYIYNTYNDNDSAKFSRLSNDLDSMQIMWGEGYYFQD